MRVALIIALLAIVTGCGFGFFATFEPPGWPVLQIVYAIAILGCLVAMGRLLLVRKPSN